MIQTAVSEMHVCFEVMAAGCHHSAHPCMLDSNHIHGHPIRANRRLRGSGPRKNAPNKSQQEADGVSPNKKGSRKKEPTGGSWGLTQGKRHPIRANRRLMGFGPTENAPRNSQQQGVGPNRKWHPETANSRIMGFRP